jgi:hypothetical protein
MGPGKYMLPRGRIFMKRRARPIVQYTVFLLFLVKFNKKIWLYNMCSLELLQSMTGYLTCLHQQVVLTCYRLDGLRFEFRSTLGIFFSPKPSRAVMVLTQPSVQWVPGFFPGIKAAWVGSWTTHLYLVLRIQMKGAIPLLPLYALIAWTGKTVPLYNSCLFDHSI